MPSKFCTAVEISGQSLHTGRSKVPDENVPYLHREVDYCHISVVERIQDVGLAKVQPLKMKMLQ